MPQGRDSRFRGNDRCFEGDSTWRVGAKRLGAWKGRSRPLMIRAATYNIAKFELRYLMGLEL